MDKLLAFSLTLVSCLPLPKPNFERSSVVISSIFFSQAGCSLEVINQTEETQTICINWPFLECDSVAIKNSNYLKLTKLKSGIKDIAKKYDRCVIDAYDQILFLDGLTEGNDPFLSQNNYRIKFTNFRFDANCDSLPNKDGLMDRYEIIKALDPSVYLAIYSQNSDCRLQIPLTENERIFATEVRSGKKQFFK